MSFLEEGSDQEHSKNQDQAKGSQRKEKMKINQFPGRNETSDVRPNSYGRCTMHDKIHEEAKEDVAAGTQSPLKNMLPKDVQAKTSN